MCTSCAVCASAAGSREPTTTIFSSCSVGVRFACASLSTSAARRGAPTSARPARASIGKVRAGFVPRRGISVVSAQLKPGSWAGQDLYTPSGNRSQYRAGPPEKRRTFRRPIGSTWSRNLSASAYCNPLAIAPGLLVQRVTHGIVQGHRSTFVPGLIEGFASQYRADRLHLALVGDAKVERPCATHLLSQRIGCAPQPGSAPWRRRRRGDAGKSFQRLDDTRAIAQAVQDGHAFGEIFQREVETPLIGFCPPDVVKMVSYSPRRSELTRHHECLRVQLARCGPLALPVERASQIGQAGEEQ